MPSAQAWARGSVKPSAEAWIKELAVPWARVWAVEGSRLVSGVGSNGKRRGGYAGLLTFFAGECAALRPVPKRARPLERPENYTKTAGTQCPSGGGEPTRRKSEARSPSAGPAGRNYT